MRLNFGITGLVLGAILGFVTVIFGAAWSSGWNLWSTTFLSLLFGWIGGGAGAIAGVFAGCRLFDFLSASEERIGLQRTKAVVAASWIAPLALAALMLAIVDRSAGAPSDALLMQEFRQNRSNLEAVVKMLGQDKSLRNTVGPQDQWITPDTIGVTWDRKLQYDSLLQSIGGQCEASEDASEIRFPQWGQGCAVCDDEVKGIAFVEKQPKWTVDSLEHDQFGAAESRTLYRHIEGNWYLYYDHIPD